MSWRARLVVGRAGKTYGSLMRATIRTGLVAAVAAVSMGCLTPKPLVTQGQDISNAVACVEKDWGKPVGQIAADCLNNEEAVAQDIVADIEAVAEGQAILAGADIAKVQATFPYSSDKAIMDKVATKRASWLAAHQAPVSK